MATAQQNGRGAAPHAGEGEAPGLGALREDVGGLADAAVQRGYGFVEAARVQAVEYADQRKGDAARSVSDLARALRDSGRGFDDRPNIRAVMDSAADGLDGLAGTIRDRSYAELYADAERIARARPAAVAAAGAVAGFLLARFVKASSDAMRAAAQDIGREVSDAARRPTPRA